MSSWGQGLNDAADRIVDVRLDEKSVIRWRPEIEQERNLAIFDLLERNSFRLVDGFAGPYALELSLRDATLCLRVKAHNGEEALDIALPVRPLRRIIKDYFLICDSYYQAIRGATPSRIETIDMARRSLHNEGSEMLREALAERVDMDLDTARRLFTLVCVLHLRG